MKKLLSLIIGIILIQTQVMPVWAQTPADIECAQERPDYEKTETDWEESVEKTISTYRPYFESSQKAYHLYIECLFEYSRATLLQHTRRRQGTFQAETPNIPWMNPSAACLEPNKLKEVIEATKSNHLITPALEAYEQYRDHLKKMAKMAENSGSDDLIVIQFLNDGELESSMVAMDLGMHGVNELRSYFVIHVHFQCLLNNLEKYRRALGEIRRIVDALPQRLENASITK